MILKSELSSKHTFEAINSYPIPALSHGFPVLDWTITELDIIDSETRKMLQQYHAMHSQSEVTRLYLPRKTGGRGLINITNPYKNAIINFSSYLLNSEEQFLKLTSNWQVTRGEKSIRRRHSDIVMKLVMIFINWLPWGNGRGNSPSNPRASTNWRPNSKERICMGNLQNT